jgi:hypothetical protein
MAILPPVVLSKQVGGPVYLLEWQQLEPDVWGASIAWVEWDGQQWRPRRVRVMAEDLTRIEGQNYKGVPRVKLAEMLRDQERRRRQGQGPA